MASQLPGLTENDVMGLGRFEVAARVGTGIGSAVAVVTGRTEPLPPATGQASAIRAGSAAAVSAAPADDRGIAPKADRWRTRTSVHLAVLGGRHDPSHRPTHRASSDAPKARPARASSRFSTRKGSVLRPSPASPPIGSTGSRLSSPRLNGSVLTSVSDESLRYRQAVGPACSGQSDDRDANAARAGGAP